MCYGGVQLQVGLGDLQGSVEQVEGVEEEEGLVAVVLPDDLQGIPASKVRHAMLECFRG